MADFIESMEDWQGERNLVDCNRFMFQNQINCDVTFLLGLKREAISAHKYMLVCRSSVFQSIFCGTIAGDKNTIPVSDVEPDTFRGLLLYIYTDEVKVDDSNVKDLLYAAKKYAVKGLVEQCLNFLHSSITVDNVCTILEMVHMYNGKNIEGKCISFVHEHAKEVLKSRTFTKLCQTCVQQIIQSDEMILDEKTVLEAVLKWAELECRRRNLSVTDENQRTVLGPILYHIRFPLLDSVYFTNSVSSRDLLSEQEIISMYQFYNGRAQQSSWKFSARKRRGFSLHSVLRYSFISMEGFHKSSTEEKDVIRFSCSEPILLHGVIVYGSIDDNAEYDARIELSADEDKGLLDSCFNRLSTTRMEHTYEIMFSKPVSLQTGKQYMVSLQMTGPPTKLGSGGKVDCVSEGVTFHFLSKTGSRTTVEKGQIPGLLFTALTKQKSTSSVASNK
ncbi:BTB/POZ domain-containing protein 6-like [Mya arenaria]|uniref:BTB/POZ domain-containing protein 6-like n=1 Tax=Mya arenaria TaxID=6604 RepID=UPI0022E83B72|nr:BTB/POZ domain-containing protein 6-like [Mya arenaria]